MSSKTKEKIELDLQEDLFNQLKAFKDQDESGYDHYVFRRDRCLVKVFKFVPSDKTVELSKSAILMPSSLNGEWKPSLASNHEKVVPIVKVLKRGEEAPKWIKEGALYTVPMNDIVGETFNPDFLHIINTYAKAGQNGKAAMAHVPEDVPQKLNKIEVQWERYKFAAPDKAGKVTEEESLVYLIPSMKLEADYII